jgi:chromate transport protein ChrA
MINNNLISAYLKGIRIAITSYIIIVLIILFGGLIGSREYGDFLFLFAILQITLVPEAYKIGSGDELSRLKCKGLSFFTLVLPSALIMVLLIRLFKNTLGFSDLLTIISLFFPFILISIFYVHYGYMSKKKYDTDLKITE